MNCQECPHRLYHEKKKERSKDYYWKHRKERMKKDRIASLKYYYEHREEILKKMRIKWKKDHWKL